MPTTMNEQTDRELVDSVCAGDARAFGVLVRRHQSRILRLAFHLLSSSTDAEDVAQETFVRAYQAIRQFDGRSELFTWLYRIAVNLSLNRIRSRRARRESTSFEDPRVELFLHESSDARASDPASAAEQKRELRALMDGMDALSESLRTTLILVCVDGLSQAEVARILGCSEGTIAWRVHEARRKLTLHMQDVGYRAAPTESGIGARDDWMQARVAGVRG